VKLNKILKLEKEVFTSEGPFSRTWTGGGLACGISKDTHPQILVLTHWIFFVGINDKE
jgi:hypothetical protein